MRDLWVDFNDVGSDDEVETLVSFAEPGVVVAVGASIVVGDDDGTVCQAQVLSIDGPLVRVRLDRGSLQHLSSVDVVGSPITAA